MKLIKAEEGQTQAQLTNQFRGLNHTYNAQDGEFYDMENLTSDHFPILSTRDTREIVPYESEDGEITAFGASDYLYYVKGRYFHYGSERVLLPNCQTDKKHTVIRMGAYFVIFPEGIVYNTLTEELIPIAVRVVMGGCKRRIVKKDNTGMNVWDSSEPPPYGYIYWFDRTSDPAVLKMWSENEMQWIPVPSTYVEYYVEDAQNHLSISYFDNTSKNPDLREFIKQGDALTVIAEQSGRGVNTIEESAIVQVVTEHSLTFIGTDTSDIPYSQVLKKDA